MQVAKSGRAVPAGFDVSLGHTAPALKSVSRSKTKLKSVRQQAATRISSPCPRQGHDQIHRDAHPALLLDVDGRLVDFNQAARTLYALSGERSISDFPFDHATLNWILAQCDGGQSKAALQTTRTDRSLPTTLLVLAVDDNFSTLRTTEFVWCRALCSLLREIFALTQAETEVARLLVEGASIAQVADLRSTSIATVRCQVRDMRSKTQCQSTSEVVQLVINTATLPGLLPIT